MKRLEEEDVSCAVCDEALNFLTIEERQEHYNAHFPEADAGSSSEPSRPPEVQPYANSRRKPLPREENIFWHVRQDSNPPSNVTPGLIPVLRRLFTKLHSKGTTTRVVLCKDGVCHVGTEFFDMGWGCGYRNFLMACSSLVTQNTQPLYSSLLDVANGSVVVGPDGSKRPLKGPGVRGLQSWIEDAWERGFDDEGAIYMKHKLINTRSWIGTGDIYVAFVSRGIPAYLVDFPKPKVKDSGSKPAKLSEDSPASALTRWIVNYFDDVAQYGMQGVASPAPSGGTAFDRLARSPVTVTDRMPIILQHEGHSRLVVGYEKTKAGSINILMFDPGKKPRSEIRKAALAFHLSSRSTTNSPPAPSPGPSRTHRDRLMGTIRKLTPQKLTSQSKRRSTSPLRDDDRSQKRARGGEATPNYELNLSEKAILEEEGVVALDNISNELQGTMKENREQAIRLCDELDPLKTVGLFRVNHSLLSRNDQYQILYFPLFDPLTPEEQASRKIVTSVAIAPDP